MRTIWDALLTAVALVVLLLDFPEMLRAPPCPKCGYADWEYRVARRRLRGLMRTSGK